MNYPIVKESPKGSTVSMMEEFDAEKNEDNGYPKPAGAVVRYVGGLIGFVVAMTIWWFLESHR